MTTEILVNIGSVNGLLPDGTKPLPEPMLTYHHWDTVTFIWCQFLKRTPAINHLNLFENYLYKIAFKSPRGRWVTITCWESIGLETGIHWEHQTNSGPVSYWQDFCCKYLQTFKVHYTDVIMTPMASQITSLTVVYSTIYWDKDQRKHQSSALLAFVWGIHRDRWIPRTKGQLCGKCFHSMTSSC